MDWINKNEKSNIYNDIIPIKTIFYLYEFLGDGYEITQNKFINNLEKSKNDNEDWNIQIIRYKHNEVNKFVNFSE